MNDEIQDLINQICQLTELSPSGLCDPASGQKLVKEWDELYQAVLANDQIGALLEAADVAYYTIKRWHCGTDSRTLCNSRLSAASSEANHYVGHILSACVAKYTRRFVEGLPKDDEAERELAEIVLKN